MHDTMVETEDVCLVESVGNFGVIEKNCGTSPNSSLHDNILNVHNMHMQIATTHYVATTNSINVEVM
jgi:hypothetical protein